LLYMYVHIQGIGALALPYSLIGLLAILGIVLAITEILAKRATSEGASKKAHEMEMMAKRHAGGSGEPTTTFEVKEERGNPTE
jgi:hypothetical protein